MEKLTKFSVIFAAILFATYSIAFSYDDPDPAKTFYGDANGDMTLQLNDVTVHKNFILFGDAAYDTPQPDTMTRKDDTCDVFPDGVCQLSDITQMENAILGSQFSTVWNSWEILDIDLPASASVGIEEPFHLNVRGILGGTPWGRPGINVKLTVAPDSAVSAASVFGRTCTGPPECAVSVSITDMPSETENSTTESDADGFSFRADEEGTLTLIAEFSSHTLFNIPATSVRFNVTINERVPVTWYVDKNAPAAGDGLSWATAFQHPQTAVDAAFAGDNVWVTYDYYYRPLGGNEPVLTMKDSVSVYGGFRGDEDSIDQRPFKNSTLLSGRSSSYHVVVGASNAWLDGFNIGGGNAVGGGQDDNGAGLYNYRVDDLVLKNCYFEGNAANSKGGGIYNYESSVTLMGVTLIDNSADVGGGVLNDNSSFYTYNCRMDGNTANSGGGGIKNESGSISNLNNTLFSNNAAAAAGYGGAIYSTQSTVTAVNNTFKNNTAFMGGAISHNNSTVTISNSILWGNTATISDPEINGSGATVTYSDVAGGYTGLGNIDADPLFNSGMSLLGQVAAGQAVDSPCLDAGSDTAANMWMDSRTTRTDNVFDSGQVDMGYHEDAQPYMSRLSSPISVYENIEWTISYTCNDPNGLPVTIDYRESPSDCGGTLTDYGDGTALIASLPMKQWAESVVMSASYV